VFLENKQSFNCEGTQVHVNKNADAKEVHKIIDETF
jgi:hypothetical protein